MRNATINSCCREDGYGDVHLCRDNGSVLMLYGDELPSLVIAMLLIKDERPIILLPDCCHPPNGGMLHASGYSDNGWNKARHQTFGTFYCGEKLNYLK